MTGPQAMAVKVRAVCRGREDAIYEAENWEGRRWGIRVQFYDDEAGVVSMMVYHSMVRTEADAKATVALLEAE